MQLLLSGFQAANFLCENWILSSAKVTLYLIIRTEYKCDTIQQRNYGHWQTAWIYLPNQWYCTTSCTYGGHRFDTLSTGQLLTLGGHEGQLCFGAPTCSHGNLLKVLLWECCDDAVVKCVRLWWSLSWVSPVCYVVLRRLWTDVAPVNSRTLWSSVSVFLSCFFFSFFRVCVFECVMDQLAAEQVAKYADRSALVPKSLSLLPSWEAFGTLTLLCWFTGAIFFFFILTTKVPETQKTLKYNFCSTAQKGFGVFVLDWSVHRGEGVCQCANTSHTVCQPVRQWTLIFSLHGTGAALSTGYN